MCERGREGITKRVQHHEVMSELKFFLIVCLAQMECGSRKVATVK
jgi:hypothetical protein